MRVNARFDEATQEQLEFLMQSTGRSVSHVVRESVAHYYVQVRGVHGKGPSRLLAMAGTGNSGRSDVASNVKSEVTAALNAKLGPRPVVQTAKAAKTANAQRKGAATRAVR